MAQTLEIPYGTRDALPAEAAENRALKARLAELFASFGYAEVTTPALEYADTLTRGATHDIEDSLFKISGTGKTVALRHEMTTPLSRLAVSRLSDNPLPLKLSYIADVWRMTSETQAGRQCEFCQAGVELMGSQTAASDAEILALCLKSVSKVGGLKNFRLSLGSVAFVRGLLEDMDIDDTRQTKIKHALARRDLVRFNREIDKLGKTEADSEKLRKLPYLIGKEEILDEIRPWAKSRQTADAAERLAQIYELLRLYDENHNVYFDLGLIRDFDYYTDMVFEVYAPGLGFPLAGGGRYDNLLATFGDEDDYNSNGLPATGFCVGLDRLLMAARHEGNRPAAAAEKIYVAYGDGKIGEGIKCAEKLRLENNVSAELAFAAQTKEQAEQAARERGARLVYC